MRIRYFLKIEPIFSSCELIFLSFQLNNNSFEYFVIRVNSSKIVEDILEKRVYI